MCILTKYLMWYARPVFKSYEKKHVPIHSVLFDSLVRITGVFLPKVKTKNSTFSSHEEIVFFLIRNARFVVHEGNWFCSLVDISHVSRTLVSLSANKSRMYSNVRVRTSRGFHNTLPLKLT